MHSTSGAALNFNPPSESGLPGATRSGFGLAGLPSLGIELEQERRESVDLAARRKAVFELIRKGGTQ